MQIPILFEDNHLLVIEKPVNIPVQKDDTRDLDLQTLLKQDLKIRYEKPGNVYLGLVHRLDRPVGGIMVFAKTSKAASRLSDVIRRQTMDRRYIAVVRGTPPRKKGVLEHYLYKDQRKNIVYTVPSTHKEGKKAILEYEVIEQNGDLSLLAVRILTGRSHQIRVQLSASGCPLFGDQKYGQAFNKPGQQIALWAHSLKFEHPTKKKIVEFHSFPPKEYPWDLWDYVKNQSAF
ncbi:RluA family pseudouridine synthase [Lederbergia wuyishanensis]|uniref:RNA pseudouridylate synthase n=1 Tax=Lederbergia wuyishanensis TaxID=1347903 RepID=A0ABU0D487_9BACI|nr:RluA family pseudouridine synthase [Lederbergia wuyishanensis]MCJ8008215.1 RluA family pseudouridine synthase [Lederbergia wuyishanensis]MDQ0343196.1 23S rRNA pseudouridine1911/1915/1917 synthase [Lederbergia wuyishanensis]